MKKKLLIISLFVLPLFGFTQAPLTFFRSNTKTDKLLLLPPTTLISVISKGSVHQLDSELTQETFRHTLDQLKKSFPDSVNASLFRPDSVVKAKLFSFVNKFNKEIKKERQIKKYTLPDSILILFDTSKVNYVFCTYNIGFKRTRTNLVNTHLRMEVTDLLIGSNILPLESSTLISCFIIDLKDKNILFFERDIWQNRDPTDIEVIKLLLNRIITHYFI
jgi:hypothetical protein